MAQTQAARGVPNRRAGCPALDGKRAIQLVRAHAAEWKLDPKRLVTVRSSTANTFNYTITYDEGNGRTSTSTAEPGAAARHG